MAIVALTSAVCFAQANSDSLNRLISDSSPNGTVITYTYDASGNRLSRTITVPTPAEIVVEDPSTVPPTDLADSSATLSFSATAVGQSASRTLTIRNTGQAPLTGLAASIDGAQSVDFSATGLPASLEGGASATITVQFSPATLGNRAAALHIASSDADENPFDIVLIGIGSPPTESVTFTEGPHPPFATNVPITVSSYATGGKALSVTLTFAPRTGTILTVVRNTGSAPIGGQFDQLPQGATLVLNHDGRNYPFVIHYFGGDGNDIELLWAITRVFAWGGNDNGQLGVSGIGISSVPVPVTSSGALSGKTVVALSGGIGHSLALCADGTVIAWGRNVNGQLGDGTTNSSSMPVVVLTSGALAGKAAVQVSAGMHHSLVLCNDGTAAAWGMNNYGQLGDGGTADSSVPVAVASVGSLSGETVVSLSAGQYHNLALCSDGTVASWGLNNLGQLGNGSTVSSGAPVAVDASGILSGKTVKSLAAGAVHSMALCSDGVAVTWGRNGLGQLGNNSTTLSKVPVAVDRTGVLSGKTVVALAGGLQHSAALCGDGTLSSWGENIYGQVGDGTNSNHLVPAPVIQSGALNGKQAIRIIAGANHSMALCSDGTLVSWGINSNGRLGNGTTINSNVPVTVDTSMFSPGERFIAAASGVFALHSLGIVATPPLPAVTSLAASSVDSTTATLNGTVNPNANATAVTFDYGPDSGFGASAESTPASTTGTSPVAVSHVLTGLAPGATYHFRATGTNVFGIRHGNDMAFTTLTPVQSWRQRYFGSPDANPQSEDLANPSGDGIPNLMKYALALDPSKADNTSLPKPTVEDEGQGPRLSLSFTRDPANSDANIYVEAADSPAGPWTVIASSVNGANVTGVGGVTETDQPGGNKSVQVLDTVTTSQSDHRFMRVRVTR